MKIFFTAVVLLRTDKEAAASGHPVDRIQLDDLVVIDYEKDLYGANREGFLKWSDYVDGQVNKFLYSVFNAKVIFGSTKSRYEYNLDHGKVVEASERHVICCGDIRNIVVVNYEETKTTTFEDVFEITL